MSKTSREDNKAPKCGKCHWDSKMQGKIDKYIMTSIDTIGWVFIDREKWMSKMFRNSEKAIRTISKEKMSYIICDAGYTGFPEVPTSDKSFHFLCFENITTVLHPHIGDNQEYNQSNRTP